MSLEERFFAKVNKDAPDGCWEWTASMRVRDYGGFVFYGENMLAHRASWIIHNGDIPENMCVLHKCDNPTCVNPDHLFLGTQADNVTDMCVKGRKAIFTGDNNSNSKLNTRNVLDIRKHWSAKKMTRIEMAEFFKVDITTINRVISRSTWQHI